MKIQLAAACLGMTLLTAAGAEAANSVEFKYTAGADQCGYKAIVGADLDPDGDWSAGLACNQVEYSDGNAPAWYRQISLDLNGFVGPSLSLGGTAAYTLDSHNVRAAGPGLNLFYTHFKTTPWDGSGGTCPGGSESASPEDLFTLGVDAQLWFYQAETTASAAFPDGQIRLTQFLPSGFLEMALIPSRLYLNLGGNVSLYSDDPSRIAEQVDITVESGDLLVLDSLLSGLIRSGWHAGLSFVLPYAIRVGGSFSRQNRIYPDLWIDSYDLGISGKIMNSLKAQAGWRRFVSSLGSSDVVSVGLKLLF